MKRRSTHTREFVARRLARAFHITSVLVCAFPFVALLVAARNNFFRLWTHTFELVTRQ